MKKIYQNQNIFKMKMFRKIFISFAGSLIALILIYGAFSFPIQKKTMMEVMHSKVNTIASSMSLACADAIVKEDNSFIVEYNTEIIKNNSDIFAITISQKDNILKLKQNSWDTPEKLDSLYIPFEQDKEIFKIIYSDEFNKDIFHYTMPMYISGVKWGWIHIDYSLEKYSNGVNYIYVFLTYLTFGSMIIILLVSYYIAKYILDPISELKNVANEVSNGNLNIQTSINRDDEIGYFAKNFNFMIKNLQKSENELKDSHELLEARVKERTLALDLKTKELEILNTSLDQRVKEESQKLQQNEQLLIQQSRQAAMGEMIGNIAHQWRQPLNALGLVLQNIHFEHQVGTLDDEFMKNSIDKGKMLTKSMSKTIDDFRNFFKPNKLKERFKISEVINNTIELLEASFKNYSIKIEANLDDKLEYVGYPSEFSQVILNILSNSKDAFIEHNISNKKVKIDTQLKDNYIEIVLSDNAGGIPESIIGKIFEPYFTTKEEGKGTGIGLYMSNTIIQTNMGGKLEVCNNNRGAVFTISLPIDCENETKK